MKSYKVVGRGGNGAFSASNEFNREIEGLIDAGWKPASQLKVEISPNGTVILVQAFALDADDEMLAFLIGGAPCK